MRKRLLGVVIAGGVLASMVPVFGGVAHATLIGNTAACTPGYWKTHTSNWPTAGVTTPDETDTVLPGGLVTDYFQLPALVPPGTGATVIPVAYRDLNGDGSVDTMLVALNLQGGPGLKGAAQILMRAATASYLNAADERMAFPLRRREDIIVPMKAALASGDRAQIIALATFLDGVNNSLPCPLS